MSARISTLEEALAMHMRAIGTGYVREHRFHPTRRWRFDFAMPELLIGIEVEGLVPTGLGAHQTLAGVNRDCEKYNAAQLLGWMVLRFTGAQIRSGEALVVIERAREMRERAANKS